MPTVFHGGELAVLYCFLFLYFAAAGAGPISLDALIGARRTGSQHPRGNFGEHHPLPRHV